MKRLRNYIGGQWTSSAASTYIDVINPATQEILAQAPCGGGTRGDVQKAVEAAQKGLETWRNASVHKRIQPLFEMKQLFETHNEELARLITQECGKTIGESRGELRRAIENIELCCGMPMHIQSEFVENIASGVDEYVIRQPVGVCAAICPFNFPGMIPFWFLPYALAAGNSFILKPSEKVPLTMTRIFELIDSLDIPAGVLNLLHGGKETVEAILEHPGVNAISFVGSTSVAKYIYSKGAAHGKRVQAQGGAKNPIIVMPDADVELSTKIIADSAYGCAGQRCLAASNIVLVGQAQKSFRDALVAAAESRLTGYGLEETVEMGPVISHESKERISGLIGKAIQEGGRALVDGRNAKISGLERGSFIKPTIVEDLPMSGEIIRTEIFGPVMSLIYLETIEEAIAFINSGRYGNMACIFTNSGRNARKFRSETMAGNIGINIGVAAPVAEFPFSGWKESFFGDLHGQGKHGVEFFTQTKVVVERWPKEWSRKF